MKIGCVLVLYNPTDRLLLNVIDAIVKQVDCLFISDNSLSLKQIDNNKKIIAKCQNNKRIIYKSMGSNIGIASAQNVGIRYLISKGYDYLLFLDQDSIVPSGLVKNLTSYLCDLHKEGYFVGAIGPRALNRQNGKIYKGSIKKGKKINQKLTEVTEIISSASLIPICNFIEVGLMDDTLFIDGVDHEWCWRAKQKKNLRFFIVEDFKLSHQLGEGDHKFLGMRIPIPTPFRVYYQFRNYLILIRREYVPIYWKVSNGVKYLMKFFYYPLFISPRLKYLTNILKGIFDGIVSKK